MHYTHTTVFIITDNNLHTQLNLYVLLLALPSTLLSLSTLVIITDDVLPICYANGLPTQLSMLFMNTHTVLSSLLLTDIKN